jgi:hypothetical protein
MSFIRLCLFVLVLPAALPAIIGCETKATADAPTLVETMRWLSSKSDYQFDLPQPFGSVTQNAQSADAESADDCVLTIRQVVGTQSYTKSFHMGDQDVANIKTTPHQFALKPTSKIQLKEGSWFQSPEVAERAVVALKRAAQYCRSKGQP